MAARSGWFVAFATEDVSSLFIVRALRPGVQRWHDDVDDIAALNLLVASFPTDKAANTFDSQVRSSWDACVPHFNEENRTFEITPWEHSDDLVGEAGSQIAGYSARRIYDRRPDWINYQLVRGRFWARISVTSGIDSDEGPTPAVMADVLGALDRMLRATLVN